MLSYSCSFASSSSKRSDASYSHSISLAPIIDDMGPHDSDYHHFPVPPTHNILHGYFDSDDSEVTQDTFDPIKLHQKPNQHTPSHCGSYTSSYASFAPSLNEWNHNPWRHRYHTRGHTHPTSPSFTTFLTDVEDDALHSESVNGSEPPVSHAPPGQYKPSSFKMRWHAVVLDLKFKAFRARRRMRRSFS